MDAVIGVQILDKTICISHNGKSMHPNIFFPVMSK